MLLDLMMGTKRKIVAILFLLSVTVVLGATQLIVHNQPPAGCHEHGRPAHSPEPANHLCCAAGHQTAILQKFARVADSPNCVSQVPDCPKPLSRQDSFPSFSRCIAFLCHPPGNARLRI